jgi:hypothetical protein
MTVHMQPQGGTVAYYAESAGIALIISTFHLHSQLYHSTTNQYAVYLQARTEAASSALQQLCGGLKENNASVVGDAVEQCPPEQAADLSTALAQAAANESTCATVAEVGAPADNMNSRLPAHSVNPQLCCQRLIVGHAAAWWLCKGRAFPGCHHHGMAFCLLLKSV